MKKILIPMDFTEVSTNAFRYANDMYKDERLHIIHATSSVYANDSRFLEPGMTKELILKEELTKVVLNELEVTELPDNITIEILSYEVIEGIKTYVKKNEIDAVVMGSRDKYSLLEKWIGTVSFATIKSLDVPVYLIPIHSKFGVFQNVLIASDEHLSNPEVLSSIKAWNKNYRARIKFLHIRKNDDKNDYSSEKNSIVDELVKNNEAEFSFEISNLNSNDISSSLLSYAHNSKTDLMIAIPDNQSFISALIFKSISKELVQKSDIPILFFPNRVSEKVIINQEPHIES